LDFLDLDGNMIDGDKLRESLRALSSAIIGLSISYNNLKGTIVAEGIFMIFYKDKLIS